MENCMLASEDMETCRRLLLMAVQCISALTGHLCNNVYEHVSQIFPFMSNGKTYSENPPTPCRCATCKGHP